MHQDSCLVPPCRPSSPCQECSCGNETDASGYEEFVVQVDRTFGDEAELEIDSGETTCNYKVVLVNSKILVHAKTVSCRSVKES